MYFKEYTNIQTLMKLREKTDDEIASDLTPFGFIDDNNFSEEIVDIPYSNWMSSVENSF
jgi:hypothetical protein